MNTVIPGIRKVVVQDLRLITTGGGGGGGANRGNTVAIC